jgi:hypothetical protein
MFAASQNAPSSPLRVEASTILPPVVERRRRDRSFESALKITLVMSGLVDEARRSRSRHRRTSNS